MNTCVILCFTRNVEQQNNETTQDKFRMNKNFNISLVSMSNLKTINVIIV